MPYKSNKDDRRSYMDEIVQHMQERKVVADGDLNYILFKYCKNHIKPSYNNFKNFCGELRQCATEIERRLVASYEEEKIKENGDVE